MNRTPPGWDLIVALQAIFTRAISIPASQFNACVPGPWCDDGESDGVGLHASGDYLWLSTLITCTEYVLRYIHM
jgi:hypothetical protein